MWGFYPSCRLFMHQRHKSFWSSPVATSVATQRARAGPNRRFSEGAASPPRPPIRLCYGRFRRCHGEADRVGQSFPAESQAHRLTGHRAWATCLQRPGPGRPGPREVRGDPASAGGRVPRFKLLWPVSGPESNAPCPAFVPGPPLAGSLAREAGHLAECAAWLYWTNSC